MKKKLLKYLKEFESKSDDIEIDFFSGRSSFLGNVENGWGVGISINGVWVIRAFSPDKDSEDKLIDEIMKGILFHGIESLQDFFKINKKRSKNYLPENIKTLREMHGLSQDQFSVQIGRSKATISSYEVGSTEPSIATLLKLKKIYNMNIDAFIAKKLEYKRMF